MEHRFSLERIDTAAFGSRRSSATGTVPCFFPLLRWLRFAPHLVVNAGVSGFRRGGLVSWGAALWRSAARFAQYRIGFVSRGAVYAPARRAGQVRVARG
jgi:hypothetical protein